MIINIVKHYSKYDLDFEGEIGFVTVEIPDRKGAFGAANDPVIARFEEYGNEGNQLEYAEHWVSGYCQALGNDNIPINYVSVADDEIDRP